VEGPARVARKVRSVTNLLDEGVRADVTRRLGALWAGHPVIIGPGVLAGFAKFVEWFHELGCPVLMVATSRGVGPLPPEGSYEVFWLDPPATASLTEELRLHDRMVHRLPDDLRAAVDAFDPERRGLWYTTPFVTTDEPADGRPVTGGRPASFLALEDKLLADAVWDAAEVERAPYRIVDLADDAALDAATAELGTGLGAVWSGDARDGFNGGGNYVRWLRDDRDRAEAAAFFRPRCDRVRVLPFLEGVPCSIHGFVLPDGTAALRPVEIVTLRDPAARTMTYSGLGTTWDPPWADREVMREAARRVGAHLQRDHGYRGAFGIDGVLTAEGFRPTELNTRMSAGATAVSEVDRRFFVFLQAALVAGVDTGLRATHVERLVPAMDMARVGKVVAFGEGMTGVTEESYPVTWDGQSFARTEEETGNLFDVGATPSGMFARVEPCAAVVPGQRLAPVNAALLRFLDASYGTSFGPMEPAPDGRTVA
jgi:hypothetical protein